MMWRRRERVSQENTAVGRAELEALRRDVEASLGVVFEALDKVSRAEALTSATVENMLHVQQADHALLLQVSEQTARLQRLEQKVDQLLQLSLPSPGEEDN